MTDTLRGIPPPMFDQAINTNNVRREELDGTKYVVAPINLLQPMHLNVPSNWNVNEAYLPAEQAKESVPSWNGTPLTLNHPAANGDSATANSPEMHEKTVLGRVFNAAWEDNKVTAEAWFDEQKIKEMGGEAEAALNRVLNGQSVEVSTGYRASKLPSGQYDGKTRSAVQGNLKPDHVAVLPNKQGKCSIDGGCGVGPVANSLIVTNAMITNQEVALTDVTPDSVDSYTDSEWDGSDAIANMPNPSESDDAAAALDAAHLIHPTSEDARDDKSNWKLPFRTGPDAPVNTRALVAAKAALEGARGGVEGIPQADREGAMARINDFLMDAPEEMFGSMEEGDMGENVLEKVINSIASVTNSTETTGAESPTDDSGTSDTMERTEYIEEITANSPLTEESLAERCDDGLEAIHNDVMDAAGDPDDEPGDDTMSENNDKVVFESEEAFEERVEEIVSNRQAQSDKESLASEIAANSDEYDDAESVLEDYPTEKALNTKKKDLVGGQPDFSGAIGANAQPATNSDVDTDDFTMFEGDV